MSPVETFSNWLSATPPSKFIGGHDWVVPSVQTVHILAVAAVMAAVLVVDLRLLGRPGLDAFPQFARRYLPWIWRSLAVLLVTGSILILAEPVRSLGNPVFLAKMILVTTAVGLTALAQRPIRLAAEAGRAPSFAKPFAIASLTLWVAIVFAGRWIAYV